MITPVLYTRALLGATVDTATFSLMMAGPVSVRLHSDRACMCSVLSDREECLELYILYFSVVTATPHTRTHTHTHTRTHAHDADLNECHLNKGGCQNRCINEIGTGYHCGCDSNQKLSDDQRSCEGGLILYFY